MKKKIQILAIIITAMILPCSCEPYDMVYEPPQDIYDALWNIIDRRYCFLGYAEETFGLDWNSVYHKYRSRIDEETSNYELFKVCGEMLGELRDGHVNLTSPYGTTYYRDWALDYPINFSDSLQRNYLGKDYMLNSGIKYTILPDDIAYAYIGTFDNGFGNGNLSALLYTIGNCKALILDIRNNGGGMLTAAESLAEMFTDKKVKIGYIQHKTGSGHNSFSSPEPMYLSPSDGSIWLRPVIVLTNRGVYSAANHFVMMMRELPHVTIMGDKTGGGSGMPLSNTLPNGWNVRFSACPILDAEGNHTEFGIEPDINVQITSEDWNRGADTMIEEALKLAKELTKDMEIE